MTTSTTNNNLGCTNETCNNANGIVIKPNVASLRSNNVSNFFFASRSMEQPNNSFGFVSSEVDTHMSKNNEWEAVTYLTQSIYGRCTNSTTCSEVYINNSEFYTGRSGGDVAGSTPINGTYTDQTSTTNYNTYGFYTYDDYLLNYNTNTKLFPVCFILLTAKKKLLISLYCKLRTLGFIIIPFALLHVSFVHPKLLLVVLDAKVV